MKVIRADITGFCMGVRRAVDLACAEASRIPGRVFTLGPLIHNPRVLSDLNEQGVNVMEELPSSLTGISLVIRAHGVSPQTELAIRERGGRIVDATCPRVKASQLQAASLAERGFKLFLAGEAEHAEVLGILGYAACIVAGNAAEAGAAAKKLHLTDAGAKTALIGQTTICEEEYLSIGSAIKEYFPCLEISRPICAATRERQESLRRLLGRVDAVIIAGGRGSANTRRLLAIAEEGGKPCVLAESAADIPCEFTAYQTLGLCTGASTPDSMIEEIESALNRVCP